MDIESLKSCSLLNNISEDYVNHMLTHSKAKAYHVGDYIIKTHQPSDGFYIIGNGNVDVIIDDETYQVTRADNRIIATLSTNDFFGELSLLDEQKRTASVVATSPCEVMFIEKDYVKKQLEEHNENAFKLIYNISIILTHRIKAANQRIKELYNKTSELTTVKDILTFREKLLSDTLL